MNLRDNYGGIKIKEQKDWDVESEIREDIGTNKTRKRENNRKKESAKRKEEWRG